MKLLILWIWCFPQMLLGYLVKSIADAVPCGNHFEYFLNCGSVSLGEYVFLCPAHWDDETTLKHEFGHRTQSRILGWLYLPIVGIPSIVWAGCFKKYRKRHNVSYYDFYTERWADKLGGVRRG